MRMVAAVVLGTILTVTGLFQLLVGDVEDGVITLAFGGFFLLLFVVSVLIKRLRDQRLRAADEARAGRHRRPSGHVRQGTEQRPGHPRQQWSGPPRGHHQQQGPYPQGQGFHGPQSPQGPQGYPPAQPGHWQHPRPGHPPRPPHPPHR
jgi:hypothetical protein